MPEDFALTLPDPRADGGLRHVSVTPDRVTIRRRYRNIAMRVSIPVAQFQGVAIRRASSDSGASHEIALLHCDSELSIALGQAMDGGQASHLASGWAAYFGLKSLTQSTGQTVYTLACATTPRRRSATLTARRRRYWARRKPGRVVNLTA